MKAFLHVIVLVWLGCSSRPATTPRPATQSPPSPIKLFRDTSAESKLVVQIAPDDHLLDATGATVGSFDASSQVVSISGMVIALQDVVRLHTGQMELTLPTGAWSIDVASSGEVRANGERWGHVEGFDATPTAWPRLEALFVAVPVVPASEARQGRGQ